MAPDVDASRPAPPWSKGSVTLVALCLMTALGIALGSYLALCTRSAQFSARTVSADQALQLAQTGLEEALWALNQNTWTTSGPSGTTVWTITGTTRTVTLTYPLSVPHQSGQVVLTISDYNSTVPPRPTILSTWPKITSAATVTLQSGQAFTKTLSSTTGPAPLFNNAIASSHSYVKFAAGGTVDSWNSNPANDGSFTPYTPPATPGASNFNATIAGCTNGSGYGVILEKVKVQGYVATFGLPISYATSGSPSGKILGPNTASGTNVDITRIGKSAFVASSPTFNISLPTSPDHTFSLIDVLLSLVDYLTGIDLSSLLTLKVPGSFDVTNVMTIEGPTRLFVDGNFSIKTDTVAEVVGGLLGNLGLSGAVTRGKIVIKGNGSLELFVTGDVSIGADGFDNQTKDPKRLAIYSKSSSSSPALVYDTSNKFCGVIYSDNRGIEIKQNVEFFGALLSRGSIVFSDSDSDANPTDPALKFHYDSALRNVTFPSVSTPYIIRTTTEL